MNRRLYIVEGLPCSGKSTMSSLAARMLEEKGKVCFVDEGTGNHPADYECHALSPEGEIVSLKNCTEEEFRQFLPYKIYDFLPWEKEKPLMLDKWRQFVREVEKETTYVFNCVLLQNPMCETMMRFGFAEKVSCDYIGEITEIIRSLNPVVIYLKNTEIDESVKRAAAERPGWLEAVIDYHVSGAYGRSIGAEGFDGYIRCLQERQARELRILHQLRIPALILDNPQRSWPAAEEKLRAFLSQNQ